MKRALFGAAVVALGLATAPAAQADTFVFNFCGFAGDSSSCPDGVSEASLTFDEVANADDNDYTLTVKITGTAASGDFIDAIQFKYDEAGTPDGYEGSTVPQLTSNPAGTWNEFFGSIPNQCGPIDEFTANAVCAVNTGVRLSPDGTAIWVFSVDFADGVDPIALNSKVNLRAAFPVCHMTGGPNSKEVCEGHNLSPEGNYQSDTTGPSDTNGPSDTSGPGDTSGNPTGSVPEPALLSLLGLGLVGAATRLRKKS